MPSVTKSIELIVDVMIAAINEGIEERKNDKTAVDEGSEEGAEDNDSEKVVATGDEKVVAAAEETPADEK